MTGRARVDRGATVGVVLRDMRRAAALTATGDKVGGIIVLVFLSPPTVLLGLAFPRSCRARSSARPCYWPRSPTIDDEAIAVFPHQMSHVAEPDFLAGALRNKA